MLHKHPSIKNLFVTEDGRAFLEIGTDPGHGGYHYCAQVKKRRHVLICETFTGERPRPSVVRHLNGVPGDDRIENLAWGTQKENCQDTVRHENSTKGKRNAQAKLSEEQIIEIRQRWAKGESPTLLAFEFGMSQPGIQDIVRGRTWGHLPLTTKGL